MYWNEVGLYPDALADPWKSRMTNLLWFSLAYAELYIIIACVFRRFDLELYDTERHRDLDIVRDCAIGETSVESRGVRVKRAPPKG